MAQTVNLWGATYNNVPAIDVPSTGNTIATFTDVTDTTATASDVAAGKYFYNASGQRVQGSGSSGGYVSQDANGYIVVSPTADLPVLKSKSITANGTYNPSSDSADGYSSVSVNVSPSLTTKTITANGTYNASSDNADGYSSVTVNVQASGANVETLATNNIFGQTATFTLKGEPKAFFFRIIDAGYGVNVQQSNRNLIIYVVYDGTNTEAMYGNSGNLYDCTTCSFTYSGTTLTIRDTAGGISGFYKLTYIY